MISNGPTGPLPMDLRNEADLTSSISSEIEAPGTFPNLTSSGRISPHRVRPLRDQETQLAELKKENFGLKLRIYHLEEALKRQNGDVSEDWEMNIELHVKVDQLKQDIEQRDNLVRDAKEAMDAQELEIRKLQEELAKSRDVQSEVEELMVALRRANDELEDYRLEAEQARQLTAEKETMVAELQDELQELQNEMETLRQQLKEKSTSLPVSPTKSSEAQTVEPIAHRLKQLEEEVEEYERLTRELRSTVIEKDKRIQELELELLRATNRMAAMATDHAQQMESLTDQINNLKAVLRERDQQLHQKESELQEQARLLRDVQRQLSEAQELIEQLKSRLSFHEEELREKEKQIEDLRRRLRDAQHNIERLERRIRDLEQQLREQGDQNEHLRRLLKDREDELTRLKAELVDKESALSAARLSAHSTNMDVHELQTELDRLRELVRVETKLKGEAESVTSAKEELIRQLRTELDEVQRRLRDAEERLLQMAKLHAAEKEGMQTSSDDLARLLEEKNAMARSLQNELSGLRAENQSLMTKLDEARQEIADLQGRVLSLEQQLLDKERLLEQSERTIASLQRSVEELAKRPGFVDVTSATELARLQAQLQALHNTVKSKDAEIASLRQAVLTKDMIVRDLQQELDQLREEKQHLEEMLIALNSEKADLEEQLRASQDAAAQSGNAFEQARQAAERLREQVLLLELRVKELSRSPQRVNVATSPHRTPPSSEQDTPSKSDGGSTTMIFGGLSDNILLLILQKLEELYKETIAGRTDSKLASSSLAAKLDELARLQKHLRSLLRRGADGQAVNELSETLQREMEALRAEFEAQSREGDGQEATDFSASLLRENLALQQELSQARERIAELEQRPSSPGLNSSLHRLEELQRDNQRLLEEVEHERRQGQTEREAELFQLRRELEHALQRASELEGIIQQLKVELSQVSANSTLLRRQLEMEKDRNSQLQAELAELKLQNLRHQLQGEGVVTSAASLPNLHSHLEPPCDHWTMEASSFTLGEHPDINELIRRHQEVSRLNRELQRRCEEKLKTSPKSARPASAADQTSTSYWQTRLRQQEQSLRTEMQQRERSRQAQVRELERHLAETVGLREQLESTMTALHRKEEEACKLESRLKAALDKVSALESQMDRILAEKNATIHLLESKMVGSSSRDQATDSLRRQNTSLQEEKLLLSSRLASCQDQVVTLKKELELYQQLLQSSTATGAKPSSSVGGLSLTAEKVLKLLEEIRSLRRQLEESIGNNTALSDQLHSRIHRQHSPQKHDWSPSSVLDGSPRSHHNLSASHSSRTRVSNHLDSFSTPSHLQRPPLAASTAAAAQRHAHVEMRSTGTQLEERIRQVLQNSEGIDPAFLQELLKYLQEQREQLDNSQHLLEQLQREQGVPTVSHITVTTQHTGAHGHSQHGNRFTDQDERPSSRASSVDLSAINDQLRRTQSALRESKTLLKKQHRHLGQHK